MRKQCTKHIQLNFFRWQESQNNSPYGNVILLTLFKGSKNTCGWKSAVNTFGVIQTALPKSPKFLTTQIGPNFSLFICSFWFQNRFVRILAKSMISSANLSNFYTNICPISFVPVACHLIEVIDNNFVRKTHNLVSIFTTCRDNSI